MMNMLWRAADRMSAAITDINEGRTLTARTILKNKCSKRRSYKLPRRTYRGFDRSLFTKAFAFSECQKY